MDHDGVVIQEKKNQKKNGEIYSRRYTLWVLSSYINIDKNFCIIMLSILYQDILHPQQKDVRKRRLFVREVLYPENIVGFLQIEPVEVILH